VSSPAGRQLVDDPIHSQSIIAPLCVLLYVLLQINVLLGVFNLIPVPPLDGSHVLRHFLPDQVRRVYDMMGMFGLLILVYFGHNFLSWLLGLGLGIFYSVLSIA
jgi:Zn-dependent protease